MIVQKNHIISSKSGRPFLLDVYIPEGAKECPIVLFAHGFKGFKDWGCWHLIAEEFVKANYVFVKFNFSHNGTTIDQPIDFADLDAFGKNNYTKELQDLDAVIDWVSLDANWPQRDTVDNSKTALIGHSRGGALSIIKAANDQRIKALITWASVARLDYSWYQNEEKIAEWRTSGVLRALNGRTKQMMPLYYQLFTDFMTHEKAYSVELALQKRDDLPMLIVHGTKDPAVPFSAAKQLKEWKKGAELVKIEGADHVFGGKHPWENGAPLGADGLNLCAESISFLGGID